MNIPLMSIHRLALCAFLLSGLLLSVVGCRSKAESAASALESEAIAANGQEQESAELDPVANAVFVSRSITAELPPEAFVPAATIIIKPAVPGEDEINEGDEDGVMLIPPDNFWKARFEEIADLSIFDSLKDKIKLSSLWEDKGKPAEFKFPADSDQSYKWGLGAFLEEPKIKTVYSFPVNKTKCRISADLSGDGKLLYVIDNKNVVHVIEVDSGKEKTFESPLKDAYAILADRDGAHVFLASEKSLVKVSVNSHNIMASLDGIIPEILDWDRAVETNDLAAVNDSQVMYVNSNFERCEIMPDAKARGSHVAIHPNGTYIAGSADGKLFRWYVADTPHRVETMPGDFFAFYYNPVTCDKDSDRWFDIFGMHEYTGTEHTDSRELEGQEPPFIINPLVSDAISCSTGSFSWCTLVGTMQDGSANPPVVLASMRWRYSKLLQSSYPIRIDAKEVKKLWGTRKGNRVAMYTDKDIRVCDRPVFDDTTGEDLVSMLGQRVYYNQIDKLEAAADFIRDRNWPEKRMTGETIYGGIAERVGVEWAWSEMHPNDPDAVKALAALEKLKAAGNDMALAASAYRHINLGHEARGSGWAKDVTPEGFAELDRRLALAKEDLDKLLAMDKPPGVAFAIKIQSLKYGGPEDINDGLALVKRCMELYPDYYEIHVDMAYWLLPRWGGVPGATHKYIEKIASLYPPKLQDPLYANLAIAAAKILAPIPLYGPDEANIDLERTYRGAEMLMAENKLGRFQNEWLVNLLESLGDVERANKFADYHVTHFISPTPLAHCTKACEILPHHKGENMG